MTKSSQAINDSAAAPVSDRGRDYLTVVQAADFLQLSQSSVRSYIREGKLKAFRIAGLRKVLIARGELMKLLEPARHPNKRRRNDWLFSHRRVFLCRLFCTTHVATGMAMALHRPPPQKEMNRVFPHLKHYW